MCNQPGARALRGNLRLRACPFSEDLSIRNLISGNRYRGSADGKKKVRGKKGERDSVGRYSCFDFGSLITPSVRNISRTVSVIKRRRVLKEMNERLLVRCAFVLFPIVAFIFAYEDLPNMEN